MASTRPGAGLLSGETNRTGFTRIVRSLVWLIIAPTVVLLVLGILMLVFNRAGLNIVFGILVVALVGVLITGTVLALVFLHREANVSKLQSDFVSKVSHELRTPLTSIRMFVETLQLKRVSSPGLRKYVAVAEIPRVRNGLGVAILSTSKGLMTDREARQQRTGGELLAVIW